MQSYFRYLSFSLILTAALLLSCTKENEPPVDKESLMGTWRVKAFRYGQDSSNANAWHPVDYGRSTTVIDLYCVNDSRVNQSFVSKVNCAYDVSAGSSVGVVSADCARTIFLKDTVWFEQTNYDLSFSANGQCSWLEAYRFSRHVNTINQPCNNLRYNPESLQQQETKGIWTLNEANRTIDIDYSPDFSRMGNGQIDQFRITSFNGSSFTIKLVGGSGNELRLEKL